MENKTYHLQIELTEEVYSDLQKVLDYSKSKQALTNFKNDFEVDLEVLVVGAIIWFIKGFKNQKNMSYSTDYEKLRQLVNFNHFASEGKLKNRFKEYMKKENISQQQICHITGLPKSNVSAYINNRNQMSMDSFLKMWVAIGCPPIEEILYRES